MYINVLALALVVGLVAAFFLIMWSVARNAWEEAEVRIRLSVQKRNEELHQRREVIRARQLLQEERNRQLQESRRGFEVEVKAGHRPLTLEELQGLIPKPLADYARGGFSTNLLRIRVADPDSPWPDPANTVREVTLTKMRFVRQRPLYDPRHFDSPPVPGAVPMPYPGFPLPPEAFEEEEVWVYDGKVIVSPVRVMPTLRPRPTIGDFPRWG